MSRLRGIEKPHRTAYKSQIGTAEQPERKSAQPKTQLAKKPLRIGTPAAGTASAVETDEPTMPDHEDAVQTDKPCPDREQATSNYSTPGLGKQSKTLEQTPTGNHSTMSSPLLTSPISRISVEVVESIYNSISSMKDRVDSISQEVSDLQQQYQQLTIPTTTGGKRKVRSEENAGAILRTLEGKPQMNTTIRAPLFPENDKLPREVERLRKKLDEIRATADELDGQFKEVSEIREAEERLRMKLEENDATLSALQSRIWEIEGMHVGLQQQSEAMAEDIPQSSEAVREEMQQQINAICTKLQQSIDAVNARVQGHVEELHAGTQQIQGLSDEVQEFKGSISSRSDKHAQLLQQHGDEIESMRGEIQKLKEGLSKLNREHAQLLQQHEAEIKRRQADWQTYQQIVNDFQAFLGAKA